MADAEIGLDPSALASFAGGLRTAMADAYPACGVVLGDVEAGIHALAWPNDGLLSFATVWERLLEAVEEGAGVLADDLDTVAAILTKADADLAAGQ